MTDGSSEAIGVVLSKGDTPNPFAYHFQVEEEVSLHLNDFVVVPTSEGDILGKVTNIAVSSDLYGDPKLLNFYRKQGRNVDDFYQLDLTHVARVMVLSLLTGGEVGLASKPACPGSPVVKAGRAHVKTYLRLHDGGLLLGSLYGQTSIPVSLSTDKLLPYHMAVLGTTGSGKSYTNGVLVEECFARGISVVVFDPHGEYTVMAEDLATLASKDGRADRVIRVLTPPAPFGRSSPPSSPSILSRVPITLSLEEIPPDHLAEMLSCTDAQSDLLTMAFQEYVQNVTEVTVEGLIEAVETYGKKYKFATNTVKAVLRRVYKLRSLWIIGDEVPLSTITAPAGLTIIDLSSLDDEYTQRVLAAVVLVKLMQGAKRGEVSPTVLVVEEAHIFAPQQESTASKWVLRKIAREGRKFGLGLNLTSQRIVGLDKDMLSQCNTKILLKIDSRTDLDHLLPFLAISNQSEVEVISRLPQGHALVTGFAVGSPTMVKVRKRLTTHGGSTPSFQQ